MTKRINLLKSTLLQATWKKCNWRWDEYCNYGNKLGKKYTPNSPVFTSPALIVGLEEKQRTIFRQQWPLFTHQSFAVVKLSKKLALTKTAAHGQNTYVCNDFFISFFAKIATIHTVHPFQMKPLSWAATGISCMHVHHDSDLNSSSCMVCFDFQATHFG